MYWSDLAKSSSMITWVAAAICLATHLMHGIVERSRALVPKAWGFDASLLASAAVVAVNISKSWHKTV